MKMTDAAQAALGVCIASAVIAMPWSGYDALRLPVVLLATTVLFAAGATAESDARPHRGAWWAAIAYLAAHVLSWFAAVDGWAAVTATMPVFAGFTVFVAVSRGWVGTKQVPLMAAGAAMAVGVAAFAARWKPGALVWALGNPNYAGCLCAALAVLSSAGAVTESTTRRKIVCGAGAAIAALGLWSTASRAGLVGLAVGMVVLAAVVSAPGKAKIGILAIVLAAGAAFGAGRIESIFSTTHESNAVRIELWKGSGELALAHPAVGCGAGNFSAQYPPYRRESEALLTMKTDPRFREAEDPHNTHLSVACELGVPGVLAWMALLGAVAWAAIRRRDASSAAGLAVVAALAASGGFNTLREFTPFDVLFWLGAGLAARRDEPAPVGRRKVLAAAGMVASLIGVVIASLAAASERAYYAASQGGEQEIPHLCVAVEAWPANVRAHFRLGAALRAKAAAAGEEDGPALLMTAVQHYEAVLRVRPYMIQALEALRRLYSALGEEEKANRCFEKIAKISAWYFGR